MIKIGDIVINPWVSETNSGYTMRQAIEWINEHSNKIIRI